MQRHGVGVNLGMGPFVRPQAAGKVAELSSETTMSNGKWIVFNQLPFSLCRPPRSLVQSFVQSSSTARGLHGQPPVECQRQSSRG